MSKQSISRRKNYFKLNLEAYKICSENKEKDYLKLRQAIIDACENNHTVTKDRDQPRLNNQLYKYD